MLQPDLGLDEIQLVDEQNIKRRNFGGRRRQKSAKNKAVPLVKPKQLTRNRRKGVTRGPIPIASLPSSSVCQCRLEEEVSRRLKRVEIKKGKRPINADPVPVTFTQFSNTISDSHIRNMNRATRQKHTLKPIRFGTWGGNWVWLQILQTRRLWKKL